MRRHDRRTPAAERALITAYWVLSGYGLRASRALGWLLACMAAAVLALMLCGIPTNTTKPQVVGRQTAPGQQVALTVDTPDSKVSGPLDKRVTTARAEKAGVIVVNSVVFRASGQNLTGKGTVIEMTTRFILPILLALAVLAVRGRVKR